MADFNEVLDLYFKGISTLTSVVRILSMVLMTVMTGIVMTNVVARYGFDSSFVWANELSRYINIWIGLLAATYLIFNDDHLKVEFAFQRFSRKHQRIILILHACVLMVIGILYLYFGHRYALELGTIRQSTSMEFQMFWPYLILPIFGILILVFSFSRLLLLLFRDEELSYSGVSKADVSDEVLSDV